MPATTEAPTTSASAEGLTRSARRPRWARPGVSVAAAVMPKDDSRGLTSPRPRMQAIRPPSRHTWLLPLLALAVAAAWPMQINGWNQNAHYALTRALVAGTPNIDRTQHEIGDLGTGDVSVDDGHTYSN